jgi:hypothetical protein
MSLVGDKQQAALGISRFSKGTCCNNLREQSCFQAPDTLNEVAPSGWVDTLRLHT